MTFGVHPEGRGRKWLKNGELLGENELISSPGTEDLQTEEKFCNMVQRGPLILVPSDSHQSLPSPL